jgi:hypothetical protein
MDEITKSFVFGAPVKKDFVPMSQGAKFPDKRFSMIFVKWGLAQFLNESLGNL